MKDEDLTRGMRAAQAGDRELAHSCLEKAVESYPESELGWLWLGHVSDDLERRRYCYQRVLAINPVNTIAWRALGELYNTPDESAEPQVVEPASVPVPVLIRQKQRMELGRPSPGTGRSRILPSLLLGTVLCLSLLAVLSYFFVRGDMDQVLARLPMFISPSAASNSQVYNLLASAEKDIQAGNPQAAIDALQPVVESWSSTIDKTTGYQLLSTAELRQQRLPLAINYARKMTELSPGSFSYQILAVTYDASGDRLNALSAYQQMLMWETDNDSRSNFEAARARIRAISQALGTPMP